jgi:hypothetical protein
VHRQRRGARQPRLHRVLELPQPVQLFGGDRGQRVAGLARGGDAQLDLAAPHLGADQLAQRRLGAAQLVGQAQREIQETAVDRAQLDPDARPRAPLGGPASAGAGVTGHAVN